MTPYVSASPDHATLLIEQPATFPTIADVAQPRYRLAGLRFNPATSGPSREVSLIKLSLQSISGGAVKSVAGLPAKLKASHAIWSPDSRKIAFIQKTDKTAPGGAALQLWVLDVASAHAHRIGTL